MARSCASASARVASSGRCTSAEAALQGNQQCGAFGFAGSSALMRGCRNPNGLWFDCCDWRACVASDSWDGLPVPPPEIVARRTDSVVRFVKAVFQGGAFASRSCRVMVVGPQMVRVSSRALSLEPHCSSTEVWLTLAAGRQDQLDQRAERRIVAAHRAKAPHSVGAGQPAAARRRR